MMSASNMHFMCLLVELPSVCCQFQATTRLASRLKPHKLSFALGRDGGVNVRNSINTAMIWRPSYCVASASSSIDPDVNRRLGGKRCLTASLHSFITLVNMQWMDEILHQFGAVGNHCLLVFTGNHRARVS